MNAPMMMTMIVMITRLVQTLLAASTVTVIRDSGAVAETVKVVYETHPQLALLTT